ncbi:AMP-binding protein, partial [Escherichia coli]|uniref:AMP-binding protein n=1 Tax=Escherichia coli TaxID=562 RepID=UPI0021583D36|nr:AMP-binding protein [Escherichia coli]
MDLHDLTPASRVALLVPGSPAYAEVVIALLRRGVFPVPMDATLTSNERDSLLADLDPAMVVTSQEQLDALLAAL